MGWGWLSQLIKGLGELLKVIFGTDKPAKIEIRDDPPIGPIVWTDDEFFDQFGMRRSDAGTDHKD